VNPTKKTNKEGEITETRRNIATSTDVLFPCCLGEIQKKSKFSQLGVEATTELQESEKEREKLVIGPTDALFCQE